MGLLSSQSNLPEDFLKEFNKEVLRSERFRLAVFAGILAIILLNIFVQYVFFRENFERVFLGIEPMFWSAILISAYIIRAAIMRALAGKYLREERTFPSAVQYGNAFAEISFPTLAILALGTGMETLVAVTSPAILLYFIFVLLSTLELNPRLSIFIGIVAAAQYMFLVEVVLVEDLSAMNTQYAGFQVFHVGKAILMIVAGLCAAFVADQVTRRIFRSYSVIEERNNLQKVFGQQVSAKIVDEFIRNKMEIESKRRDVCVMFLDIKDFTPFSESRTPEEIIQYQNDVFSFMIEIINRNDGIINQFMGDGFMATFGAPISSEMDSHNALHAALEIQHTLREKCASGDLPMTEIRIGLHAGEVVTGNVGTSIRKQYSITGNTVILAARLEQLNKEFGSTILTSKEVLDRVPTNGFQAEALGKVQVKGRSEPMEVYKIT